MRNGDEAGIVLSAMLELSRQQESRQRAEKSGTDVVFIPKWNLKLHFTEL